MGGQHQRQRGAGVIRSPLTMLSPMSIRTYSPSRIEPLPIRYRTSSTSSGGQFDDHGISITGSPPDLPLVFHPAATGADS